MIDLSRYVGRPHSVTFVQERRNDLIKGWTDIFETSRREGKPPRYEMPQEHMAIMLMVGLMMYANYPITDPNTKFSSFMSAMEVGGYRLGRSRNGSAWASLFVRNVQYSMTKHIPAGVTEPVQVALALAVRANLKRAHEWLTIAFSNPVNPTMFNVDGLSVVLVEESHGWVINVKHLDFIHACSVELFLQFFDRDYGKNYTEVPRPPRPQPQRELEGFDAPDAPRVLATAPPGPW